MALPQERYVLLAVTLTVTVRFGCCEGPVLVPEVLLWSRAETVEFYAGIAHRDMTPSNILMHKAKDEPHTQVKLADFGLAGHITGPACFTERVGTAAYSAPEVLQGCYGAAADVYSAGAVLIALLTGRPPFSGDTGKLSFKSSSLFAPDRSM